MVRARTAVTVLSMDGVSFAGLLAAHPAAHAALAATAESRAIANFLKQASPFAALAPARRTWLAARLTPHAVARGTSSCGRAKPVANVTCCGAVAWKCSWKGKRARGGDWRCSAPAR